MRPGRVIVGAVVAVLVAVGCSGESGEASRSPTPSLSESSPPAGPSASSSAPDAAKPTPPANADQRTDKSAIDFAVYFVDVLNYTARTGDTKELRRISTDDCKSCENIVEVTEATYTDGGYISGDGWTVKSYSAFSPGPGARRIVSLAIDTSAQTHQPHSSAPVETISPGEGRLSIYLRPSKNSWTVTRMDRTD